MNFTSPQYDRITVHGTQYIGELKNGVYIYTNVVDEDVENFKSLGLAEVADETMKIDIPKFDFNVHGDS